jgi:5-methylcytosine-specific restriction endonuclease McrA
MSNILTLDKTGLPFKWSTVEEAVVYAAKDMINWELGDNEFTLRGGVNRFTNERSEITVRSIISIRGEAEGLFKKFKPALSRRALFMRDRHICAYCGSEYGDSYLTADHIKPKSRGGGNTWMNLVTACKHCNQKKDARTPEEAKMQLLYVPYVPNIYESFILQSRRILADQMEFLRHSVPKHSRIVA